MKVDGLILSKSAPYALCAVEVGKDDKGPTGTKTLKDIRKLSKLLKDMFDIICERSSDPAQVQKDLRTFGLVISALRVDFVSLRHHNGRYSRLQVEG
ncbi:hypothetical protein BGX21_003860, partial [Mortierella sp. AD011]